MTKVIVWPFYKKFQPILGERVLEVSTVAQNSGLSPFVIGPCTLWGGHVSRNMENAWQFSKVYPSQLADGEPSDAWLRWAMAGWKDSRAHRYPMGKGARPAYSYWDGQHLGYIDARKVIYGPLYAEAVKGTDDWKQLWRNFVDGEYDTIVLRDFDAYDHSALGMSLTDVLNCPSRKMGHAFVLAMLLADDPALNQVELVL